MPTGTEGLRPPLADEEEHTPESHSPGCTEFEGCWVLFSSCDLSSSKQISSEQNTEGQVLLIILLII